ncbi:hypothetical protein CMI44_01255 [Candidatus Pacearchaeota archaeon]|jgi:membrane-associated phospholipid phosphatase|nr:hypothetical protein [Candidatus Pacearchaeota archaeon]
MKKLFDKFFEEITLFGGLIFSLFLIVIFFITGKIDFAKEIFFGVVVIYLVTLIIRLFYFKSRPKKVRYNNFLEKIDASSFPSIHTARAVFLGLFAIIAFSLNVYVSTLILFILILVFYSRIYLKKHDWIDIIGGFLLGLMIYWAVSYLA